MIRLLLKTYDNHKKYLCKCEHENFLEFSKEEFESNPNLVGPRSKLLRRVAS